MSDSLSDANHATDPQSSTDQGVRFTENALNHVRKQLRATQCDYLRLGVKESGCNGYMYVLDFLEAPATDDHRVQYADGVNVCISQHDLPLVEGTEVDMLTQGLNSALVFKNQKATSYCGCGESFAVGGDDQNNQSGTGDDSLTKDLAVNVGADNPEPNS